MPNVTDPHFIAQQLRKPEGEAAKIVGEQMYHFNQFCNELVIDSMQLNNNESILEIGFGNGKFFDKMFSKADNLQISGLDFSEEMVKQAIDNNRSAVSSGKLNIRFGSSDNIPFENNSFDIVFCVNLIYFWEEPGKHLKEIHRILKPYGKFYTGIKSKNSLVKLSFSKFGFNLYEENEWQTILQKNGFEKISINKKLEPTIEYNGEIFQMESICFIAEKKE